MVTPLSLSLTHLGATQFASQRGYDAASNVTAVNTTLAPGGTASTDNQIFCYDEQNRLVWAGSTGTPSCGTTLTPGTLTAANYTQTFSYDTLNRLTSGPLGSYTYGNTAHLHAATAIGTQYTATYDAGGNMTCRAPVNPYACTGTPTGAQLSYDNEGRLSAWQNTPTSPTTTASYLYDGAGQRVQQAVTVNGSITTTTTYIAGGLEESVSTSTSTTLTKYFSAGGLPTLERVGTNGPVSVLASDGQGTVAESFDSAGNVTSAQIYTPYGVSRYSSGSSPTSHGYTGQVADGSTGLDYYQARYYDPVAGQFTSADTANDGLNHYGYVAGNPTTYSDPTGHIRKCDDGDCGAPPDPRPNCKITNTGDDGGGCTHDCGGGSGGNKPVSCRVNPEQGDGSPCHDWRVWRDHMNTLRDTQLKNMRHNGLLMMIAGIGLTFIGAIFVILGKADPLVILQLLVVALEAFIDGIGLLTNWDPESASMFYGLLSSATAVLGTVVAMLALLNGLAAWLLWTFRAAVIGLLMTTQSFATLLKAFVLTAVGSLVQAGGQALYTAGALTMADYSQQNIMPIWDWCVGPGKEQCAVEPNGGMPDAA